MEHLKYHKLCARWVPKTKQSALRQHWTFWYGITMKVTSFLTLWQEIKFGFPVRHQRMSSIQCNVGILHLQRQRNSSRRFPPGRSCIPCFGTQAYVILLIDFITQGTRTSHPVTFVST
jgi:hypothetical protein